MSDQPTDVLVIGNGHYGLGADVAEAKKNFTKFGGHLRDGYDIFTFPPTIEWVGISAWGDVQWKTVDGSDYDADNPAHNPTVKHVDRRR